MRTTSFFSFGTIRTLLGAMLAGVLAACAAHGASGVYLPAASDALHPISFASGKSPIKHIVIIVQENRSFENIFAGFPGDAKYAPTFGYYGKKRIKLGTVEFAPYHNLSHFYTPAVEAYDHGKMNAFNGKVESYGSLGTLFPYQHLDYTETTPYWTMAKQYVLADHMFPTEFGPSFPSHLALLGGTTSLSATTAEVNNPQGGNPWGCGAPQGTYTYVLNTKHVITTGPFPCFDQFNTLITTLDQKHLSWRYYGPPLNSHGGAIWGTTGAMKAIYYSSEYHSNDVPNIDVFSDAQKGKLAAVSWVIPDWDWSDHTSAGTDYGPSWVGNVVDAIGRGPEWKSTAIVVLWDDWGGWYDNVPPPQLDYRGLGIRVGCIIISPYAIPHHISHTVYEFGSILKFAEQTFGLPPLSSTGKGYGYSDSRATSILDSFDFTQRPTKFTPIATKYPQSFYLKYPPSLRPPDDDL